MSSSTTALLEAAITSPDFDRVVGGTGIWATTRWVYHHDADVRGGRRLVAVGPSDIVDPMLERLRPGIERTTI